MYVKNKNDSRIQLRLFRVQNTGNGSSTCTVYIHAVYIQQSIATCVSNMLCATIVSLKIWRSNFVHE